MQLAAKSVGGQPPPPAERRPLLGDLHRTCEYGTVTVDLSARVDRSVVYSSGANNRWSRVDTRAACVTRTQVDRPELTDDFP